MSKLRRVIFFGGFRTKVFEWEGKTLLGSLEFEPYEEDIDLYAQYLAKNPKVPTSFLIDIIEEDFQRDVIPKLSARDQKNIALRHLDKHYRENEYTHYEVQGASPIDKKKTDILLSALINPDVLSPWLDKIKEFNVALTGIYSVPFLSQRVLDLIKPEGDNILLVSRQVRSAVRESFFKSDHLYFSRFAKLPREHRDSNSPDTVHYIVSNGTEQVQHFLRNQRVIGYADVLDIYAIVYESQLNDLPALDQIDTRRIHYVALESLINKQGLKNCEGQHSDALFSYICSTLSASQDHYAKASEKQAIKALMSQKVSSIAGVMVSICFLALSAILAVSAVATQKEIQSLEHSTQVLRQVYANYYAPIQTQIDESSNLKRAVDLANYLDAESNINLQSAFPIIGGVLQKPKYERLYLDYIEWSKYQQEDYQNLLRDSRVEMAVPSEEFGLDAGFYDDTSMSGEPLISLVPVIHLSGLADRTRLSYGETVSTIQQFVEDIRSQPGVADVVAVELPVDTREASEFQDQSGLGASPKSDNINENRFNFIVILEGQAKSAWTDEQ